MNKTMQKLCSLILLTASIGLTSASIDLTSAVNNKSRIAEVQPPDVLYGVHLGCFKDHKSARILPEKVLQLDINTPDTCTRACHGYAFAGVEDGLMCYCGNKMPRVSARKCDKKCINDTAYFCGGAKSMNLYSVVTPRKVVCYTSAKASERSDGFTLEDSVDPHLCTHYILSLSSQFDGISDLLTLKERNPQAKLMVAFGGDHDLSAKEYSKSVIDAASIETFVKFIYETVTRHQLDGVDVDWFFPTENGGVPEDKENYVSFLSALRKMFDTHDPPLLLSASVASIASTVADIYDIEGMMTSLDFINVMAFSYHAHENATGHNAPLYANAAQDLTPEQQELNVDNSIQYWISQGAPREKINLGMAAFGSSFTLAEGGDYAVGSPTVAAGKRGPITKVEGIMGYNEICVAQRSEPWTVRYNKKQQVPYTYLADQWIGYDNPRSIQQKAQYVVENGLGGAMISMLEMDDFKDRCASGGKFPLIRAVNEVLYPLQ